jgi:hypothetical protein
MPKKIISNEKQQLILLEDKKQSKIQRERQKKIEKKKRLRNNKKKSTINNNSESDSGPDVEEMSDVSEDGTLERNSFHRYLIKKLGRSYVEALEKDIFLHCKLKNECDMAYNVYLAKKKIYEDFLDKSEFYCNK